MLLPTLLSFPAAGAVPVCSLASLCQGTRPLLHPSGSNPVLAVHSRIFSSLCYSVTYPRPNFMKERIVMVLAC